MKTFLPGQIARAEDVNNNFSELQALLNAARQQLDALKTTPWETLALGPGWQIVQDRAPKIRMQGGLVCIQGTIQRGAGGDRAKILQIPSQYLQATGWNQWLGAGVAVSGGSVVPLEFYANGNTRWLSVDRYNGMDSSAGWYLPLCLTYAIDS
nr:MAG TPA: receptor binding protein [Caudoviricetes sp.]